MCREAIHDCERDIGNSLLLYKMYPNIGKTARARVLFRGEKYPSIRALPLFADALLRKLMKKNRVTWSSCARLTSRVRFYWTVEHNNNVEIRRDLLHPRFCRVA